MSAYKRCITEGGRNITNGRMKGGRRQARQEDKTVERVRKIGVRHTGFRDLGCWVTSSVLGDSNATNRPAPLTSAPPEACASPCLLSSSLGCPPGPQAQLAQTQPWISSPKPSCPEVFPVYSFNTHSSFFSRQRMRTNYVTLLQFTFFVGKMIVKKNEQMNKVISVSDKKRA